MEGKRIPVITHAAIIKGLNYKKNIFTLKDSFP